MLIRGSIVLNIAFLITATTAANFETCKVWIQERLPLNASGQPDLNGVIPRNLTGFDDPVYHGEARGFRFHDQPDQRPLFLTTEGCIKACGAGPQLNDVNNAFQIMTTWVLPVIALLSQLPYESLSQKKYKNIEAFCNWVGAPAAALTTTIWNILMIRRCQMLSESTLNTASKPVLRDSLYILSCVNQYQYPRTKRSLSDRKRDVALLRGILHPYIPLDEHTLPHRLRAKLENLTTHLAFQLRLQRRRGVYPLWLNLIWFLISFVFSIVTAFASGLGDNTTAHSLALGLLLSWMPVIVLATIVDRNPVGANRCGVLLERWLYTVDALFAAEEVLQANGASKHPTQPNTVRRKPVPNRLTGEHATPEISDDGTSAKHDEHELDDISLSNAPPRRQDTERLMGTDDKNTTQWRKGAFRNTTDFKIGEFVGQGRRMRYCAVTDTVLDMIGDHTEPRLQLPGNKEALAFRKALPSRPFAWYMIWLASQFIVGMGYATAFIVSFETPTKGLGCRTLSYTIWYLLSFFSWVFLGIWQEPPLLVRRFAWIPNTLASVALFTIMMLQAMGALNTCLCKSSVFGTKSWGGYMDFENGEFYHRAYNVQKVWATATGLGLANAFCAIAWFWRRWSHDSNLWRVKEEAELEVMEGVDLNWLT